MSSVYFRFCQLTLTLFRLYNSIENAIRSIFGLVARLFRNTSACILPIALCLIFNGRDLAILEADLASSTQKNLFLYFIIHR